MEEISGAVELYKRPMIILSENQKKMKKLILCKKKKNLPLLGWEIFFFLIPVSCGPGHGHYTHLHMQKNREDLIRVVGDTEKKTK